MSVWVGKSNSLLQLMLFTKHRTASLHEQHFHPAVHWNCIHHPITVLANFQTFGVAAAVLAQRIALTLAFF